MKKVVVVSTSLHSQSSSDVLANEFARGAADAGNTVEYISLKGKKISCCVGCGACRNTQRCVIADDAPAIAESVKGADVLCFATPVYYYSMSGQMKTLLDRCNPLFETDYSFGDVYLLTTAADDDEDAMDGTVSGMQGWLDCFGRARLAGVLRGIGVNSASDLVARPQIIKDAYEMGKGV